MRFELGEKQIVTQVTPFSGVKITDFSAFSANGYGKKQWCHNELNVQVTIDVLPMLEVCVF